MKNKEAYSSQHHLYGPSYGLSPIATSGNASKYKTCKMGSLRRTVIYGADSYERGNCDISRYIGGVAIDSPDYVDSNTIGKNGYVYAAHGGSANTMWTDGHVTNEKGGKTPPEFDGIFADMKNWDPTVE